ncbi:MULTISPECIES: hypothetical protein [Aureimonas]|jgi:hypothetical protein|uniref:Uncharacterized protein n=1 Tax=Aureimonas flava TaxID=2320271 RepID=A0A3A1WG19_9HYPH|nr:MULTISPECIES: hypothetical protein [Aureimonas]RIX99116.1 hypothetical protein D3218_15180 [Aureimonas flava]
MTSRVADPLHTLYDALAAQQAAQPTPVRHLPADERRAYMREAKRRSRERQREAAEAGSPQATDDAIRAALADAALMILATDAPGAEQVMSALRSAFPGRGGVAGTVRARCRSGTLRPTLLRP